MSSPARPTPPRSRALRTLVIGASRGIGLALAQQAVAAGEQVVATARDDEGLMTLGALGARALKLDVTLPASVATLAWQLDGAGFDRVFVNAGVFGPRLRALDSPSVADFDTVMRTNVLGPMQVIPQLVDALAPDARLLVMSSTLASIGGRQAPGGWLYSASKAALNSVLKDVALTLAGRAICIAVHPGWVRTAMGGPGGQLSPDESAADLRRLLDGLTPADNGGLFNHDGRTLPW
jgi:NAD(P)-dependent dehydrogenase (short-subunit alcohol dehydrogenase family)